MYAWVYDFSQHSMVSVGSIVSPVSTQSVDFQLLCFICPQVGVYTIGIVPSVQCMVYFRENWNARYLKKNSNSRNKEIVHVLSYLNDRQPLC